MREYMKISAVLVAGAIVWTAAPALATGGPPAPFSVSKPEHWGVITRNTIGSPVAELRFGVYGSFGVTGPSASPPYGIGSLGLEVANNSTTNAPPSEKIDFGNEVDYFGNPISALTAVGFHVFQTGENADISPTNMPNIRMEIDPTGTSTYTTMVWVPGPAPVTNRWSGYIDATTTGYWYFTGSFGATTCNEALPCTFTMAKSKVPSGKVYSVAVGKGRDNNWVGAIDGLRLNKTIIDFEPYFVRVITIK